MKLTSTMTPNLKSIHNKLTNRLFYLLILIFFNIPAFTQNAKVVGYLPTYRFSYNASISYCKVTHLNICFANPDSQGNLIIDDFSSIIDRARRENPNILIFISVGGGVLSDTQKQNWSDLIDFYSNRVEFIKKIISFVKAHDLDGVDVDLEWDAVTSGYTNFVISLSNSLHTEGKLMSSALPGTYRYSEVNSDVLDANDFINIMAYDETGPWDPDNPGQHSSFEFAENSLNFWSNNGVPKEKLILGVPFYGYNFGENSVNSFSYADMVNIDTDYADLDNVGNAYYNGRPTIRRKVLLASSKAAGIMIWELAQDRFDEFSLLTTIHDEYTALGYTTTGLCGNPTFIFNKEISDIKVYPNPASTVIYIESDKEFDGQMNFYTLDGRLVKSILPENSLKIKVNISDLNPGIYILKVSSGNNFISRKLVIR